MDVSAQCTWVAFKAKIPKKTLIQNDNKKDGLRGVKVTE